MERVWDTMSLYINAPLGWRGGSLYRPRCRAAECRITLGPCFFPRTDRQFETGLCAELRTPRRSSQTFQYFPSKRKITAPWKLITSSLCKQNGIQPKAENTCRRLVGYGKSRIFAKFYKRTEHVVQSMTCLSCRQ